MSQWWSTNYPAFEDFFGHKLWFSLVLLMKATLSHTDQAVDHGSLSADGGLDGHLGRLVTQEEVGPGDSA